MRRKILKLLGNEVMSIDIGTYNTKFVIGKSLGGEIAVKKMLLYKTPEQLYQDGQILDINNMKEFIEKVVRQEKLKINLLSFTFNSSSLILKEVSVPFANPKDLKQMLEFEIEQYFPIDIGEYNIEYKITENYLEDGVKKATFRVAALPKVISDAYLELCNMLRLKPYALDLHSNCINKLFNYKTKINEDYRMNNRTIALLDLGHTSTEVVIFEKGKFMFSRLINSGGKDIDIHIANIFNLTMKEASEKKHVIKNLTNNLDESSLGSMINEIIISGIDNLMKEIEKIFKFYTTRATGNRIDDIYIHGGCSNIKGIDKIIEKSFNIATFKIKNIAGLNIAIKKFTKIDDNDNYDIDINPYLNAIGAIIRK